MLAGGLGLVEDATAAAHQDVSARLARARGLRRVVEVAGRHVPGRTSEVREDDDAHRERAHALP